MLEFDCLATRRILVILWVADEWKDKSKVVISYTGITLVRFEKISRNMSS